MAEIPQSVKDAVVSYVRNRTEDEFVHANVYPAHGIDHIRRVVYNSTAICTGEGTDPFLPTVAAWLHDNGRIAEWQAKLAGRKDRIFHAEVSAAEVPFTLSPYQDILGEEAIANVQQAVALHSMPNSVDDSPLTVTLKDADRLDGMGAIGIMRTFTDRHSFPSYNLPNPYGSVVRPLREINESNTTLMEFPFLNIEWYFMLRSETAKRIAERKLEHTYQYLRMFGEELGVDQAYLDNHPMVQKLRSAAPHIFES
ncbi:MAG: HD domain-containing protein [Patescibacteria group bacterium]|nr:HD domain-containing protein [Patescibacteria group bacterium]